MSIRLMNLIWQKSRQKGSPLLLLLAIADNANDEGIAWPSVNTLAIKTRMSVRQVQRMLSELRDAGELAYEAGTGRGHTHTFQIRADVLEGRQDATLESDKACQDATHYQTKGRQVDTVSEAQRVTYPSERVTSGAVKGDTAMSPESPREPSRESKQGERARAPDLHPAVEIFRDIYGDLPAPYNQDLIEQSVQNLEVWRATLITRRGNDTPITKVGTMLKCYNADLLEAEKNTNGKNSAPQTRFGKQPVTRNFNKYPDRIANS